MVVTKARATAATIYLLRKQSLVVVIVVLVAGLSVASRQFLTVSNLTTVLIQSTTLGIAAIGMTAVLLVGGIDLSMGSVLVLSALLGAMLMAGNAGVGITIAGILIAIAGGAALGAFNGFCIAKGRMVPFMVTLGMSILAKGIATILTGGLTIGDLPYAYQFLSVGKILRVPTPIVILFILFFVGYYVLTRTSYGRILYLVGGNPRASRVAALPVDTAVFATYVVSGVCAALAGITASARLNSVTVNMGDYLLFDVIGAVVLGGTSIFGGQGTMIGTLLGVVLIGLVSNGLNLAGMPFFYQLVAKGIILIFAISLDVLKKEQA